MTLYGIIFYLLAAIIVVATCLAITRTNLVHTVVYLVISFFGSAMLFYLLGAPFLAALEVILPDISNARDHTHDQRHVEFSFVVDFR